MPRRSTSLALALVVALAACRGGPRSAARDPGTSTGDAAAPNASTLAGDAAFGVVPALLGMSSADAARVAQAAGFEFLPLRVAGEPADVVLHQDLAPGERAPRGSPIAARVAAGGFAVAPGSPRAEPSSSETAGAPHEPTPEPRPATDADAAGGVLVPSLLDRTPAVAQRILEAIGLGVRVETLPADRGTLGIVVGQDPPPGDRLPRGASVTLRIPVAFVAPPPPSPPPSPALVDVPSSPDDSSPDDSSPDDLGSPDGASLPRPVAPPPSSPPPLPPARPAPPSPEPPLPSPEPPLPSPEPPLPSPEPPLPAEPAPSVETPPSPAPPPAPTPEPAPPVAPTPEPLPERPIRPDPPARAPEPAPEPVPPRTPAASDRPSDLSPADGAQFPASRTVRTALEWSEAAGATSYLVELDESGPKGWTKLLAKVVEATRVPIEITLVDPTKGDFRWRVRAIVGRRAGEPTPWAAFAFR